MSVPQLRNKIVCKWMVRVGGVGSGWGFGCVRVNGWVNSLKSLSLSLSATSSHIPSLVIWFVASIACFRWMWHFHNCQKDRTCKTTKSLRSRPWTLVEGLEVRNLSRPGNCNCLGVKSETLWLSACSGCLATKANEVFRFEWSKRAEPFQKKRSRCY